MLVGAYAGSLIALPMPSRSLQGSFGCFLMLAGFLLWRKGQLGGRGTGLAEEKAVAKAEGFRRGAGIFAIGCVGGVGSGMFGVGRRVLLGLTLRLLVCVT